LLPQDVKLVSPLQDEALSDRLKPEVECNDASVGECHSARAMSDQMQDDFMAEDHDCIEVWRRIGTAWKESIGFNVKEEE
jgi:hypothetical protein